MTAPQTKAPETKATETEAPAAAPARPADPLVTLLVPAYNEEEMIAPFFAAVDRELSDLRLELLFVNDGSRDATGALLRARAEADPRVTLVELSRNFGKEAALSAGLDLARGDVVIPVDADLQDPLSVIPRFLAEWRRGFDVVTGARIDRSTDTALKRHTADAFYRLFNRLADPPIPAHVGDFRLMDRRVVAALRQMPERVRFMKGLFSWVGFATTAVPYDRPERLAGTTKFSVWRLVRLALDGLVSFSTLPLRIWTVIGAGIAGGALVYAGVVITKTLLLGRDVPGYASLMTVVLFLGGIQLLSLGVLGEYIARLFVEAKGRPVYVVDRIYGRPPSDTPAPAGEASDTPAPAGED